MWDILSAQEIISLDPEYIKIPSPMNENYQLLNFIFNNYKKDVHISLGMISKKDKNKLLDYLNTKKNRIIVYHTTSSYPVKFEELYLQEILKLKEKFQKVGFSGHHLGIAQDIAAYTLGASWIERHFTLDRTWKGTDHAASLEPDGLRKLKRDLVAVSKSLTCKSKEILSIEIEQREKLKFKGTC